MQLWLKMTVLYGLGATAQYGQMGDGSTNGTNVPVQMSSITGVEKVACGGYFTMMIKSNGDVWTVGLNHKGQLGDGTTTNASTPVQATGLSNIVKVDAGWQHGMALKNDGTMWTMGDNANGQLGNGTTTSSSTPVQVTGLCQTTSVTETAKELKANVSPNPSTGILTVQLDGTNNNVSIEVINMMGQKVYTGSTSNQASKNIDLSQAPKGIYFLNIQNGNEKINTKIVLQ